jgi:hypothetical protein
MTVEKEELNLTADYADQTIFTDRIVGLFFND